MDLSKKRHLTIGIPLFIAGIAFLLLFMQGVEFTQNPIEWFMPSYYEKMVPLFLAGTLIVAGFACVMKWTKTNFYLAIFGHSTSETILSHWLGLQNAYLPNYAFYTLLPLSILVLLIAYTNVLKRKKLTIYEALSAIAFGIFLAIMPMLD